MIKKNKNYKTQRSLWSVPTAGLRPVGTRRARQISPVFPGADHHEHLWLCLYFYHLPLEVLPVSGDAPRAVMAEQKHKAQILICDSVAGRLGVCAGLSANAALALAPDLEIQHRDINLELKVLRQLADRVTRFTPAVSIESSDTLLLDIKASLKLFGGLDKLRDSVTAGIEACGYRVISACAPTALAALWLARAGQETAVLERATLPGRLASLPVECLCWPESVQRMLAQMGIRTLGECIRLPRDGLARRIGPERLCDLDRGFGRQAETRQFHISPKIFRDVLELPLETADSAILIESLKILMGGLKDFLFRHQGGTRILWIRLYHYDEPATLLRIGLRQTATDTKYLLELIRIRFADMHFSAPVLSVELQTDLVNTQTEPANDLFGPGPDQGESAAELLQRLRVRLGDRSVYGIRVIAEHRPEFAWQPVNEPDQGATDLAPHYLPGHRPLWMLSGPLVLKMVAGRPEFQGVLQLDCGPERIETGWWDGRDIRRDYYVAANRRGMRLWLFRDCRDSRWYLHGLFG